MSDTTGDQQITPQATQQSDAGDTNTGDNGQKDYQRLMSDLAAENKKYRQNYTRYKQELDDTREELQKVQESTLQEQGRFKDLYEKTQRELAVERETRLKDRAVWTGHVVASSFAAEAAKVGCLHPVSLLKIANADGLLAQPDLVAEDSFDVNAEAISRLVQDAKKSNPILFAKATPAVRDGVPATGNTKVTRQDLTNMKMEDLLNMAKNM